MLQFKTNQCSIGITPSLAPGTAAAIGQTLTNNINAFAFGDDPANVPAVPCRQQGLFSASGKTTQYPQIAADPDPAAAEVRRCAVIGA